MARENVEGFDLPQGCAALCRPSSAHQGFLATHDGVGLENFLDFLVLLVLEQAGDDGARIACRVKKLR
jgi:hypothetical protein